MKSATSLSFHDPIIFKTYKDTSEKFSRKTFDDNVNEVTLKFSDINIMFGDNKND